MNQSFKTICQNLTKTNINLRKLSEFLSCEKKLPPADSLFKKVACVIED